MKTALHELPVITDDGEFTARYNDDGLVELNFPSSRPRRSPKKTPPPAVPAKIRAWHRLTGAALALVLAGRPAKQLPPLVWAGKTEFQQAVWRELLKIRGGDTLSYGEIAKRIGRPKAVRAVGGACGANPIPVLVPCHRVLAANHKIGGFSGGLAWKKTLLTREGIAL